MLAQLAADAVLVLHLGFIAFVVLGGFLVTRWRRVAWMHIPCAIWGGLVELGGWMCPLTPLENRLRAAAGSSGYGGSFIDHYITSIVYPAGLTRELQLALGIGVIAVNLCAYGLVALRSSRARRLGARR